MQLISKNRKYLEKGQVMLVVVVFFMSFVLIVSLGLINPIIKQFNLTSDIWKSKESYYISESGIEDVVFRIKNNMTVSSNENLKLNGFDVDTLITDTLDGKILTTESDRNGYIKKIETKIKEGEGVSFNYGVQVGQGGFTMSGSSGIVGNVFSGGPIIGCSSCYITGSAISANSPGIIVEQENGVSLPSPSYVIFGKTSDHQDFAQSFKVSSSTNITQINLYIKKISSPTNITLRLVKNYGSSPSGNSDDIISSVVIPASIITTNYGWIEVPLPTNSSVLANTTYWIVLDASRDNSKYYVLGANLDSSYLNGESKTGEYKESWSNTGYDGYFKIFTGGSFGKISGEDQDNRLEVGTDDDGIAYAHTVSYVDVEDEIKCQIGIFNNKNCDTSYPDPSPAVMPVSDGNIEEWKSIATLGGVIDGNYSLSGSDTASLGPKKIIGNLSLSNSSVLTVTGTLYVTGNISLANYSKIRLSPLYGENSGVIVSDGRVNIANSFEASGSGQEGSYFLILTTSSCPSGSGCSGQDAMSVSGSGKAIILNAQKGTIRFENSAKAREATANKIIMTGESIITYESGISNPNFSSGPSGGFNIESWKQLEQ